MELELKYAFTSASGTRITKLTLRRPKVKDLKAAARHGSSAEDREIGLFAILSGLVPEDLQEMDLLDYERLQDAFRGMLDRPGNPVGQDGAAGTVVPVSAQ